MLPGGPKGKLRTTRQREKPDAGRQPGAHHLMGFPFSSRLRLIRCERISTVESRKDLDRSLDALDEAGCERVFEALASGAAAACPNLAVA